jgi:hypothetical protein
MDCRTRRYINQSQEGRHIFHLCITLTFGLTAAEIFFQIVKTPCMSRLCRARTLTFRLTADEKFKYHIVKTTLVLLCKARTLTFGLKDEKKFNSLSFNKEKHCACIYCTVQEKSRLLDASSICLTTKYSNP